MLSPSPVILSEAKNLRSLLRVDSAKHLCSSSEPAEPKKQLQGSFARPKKRGWLTMTHTVFRGLGVDVDYWTGCHLHGRT